MTHLDRVREQLSQEDVPSFLVSDMTNVRWLTGFTGSFGFVVVTPDGGLFLTDCRYSLQAAEEVIGLETRTYAQPVEAVDFLRDQVKTLGIDRLSIDAQAVSVATFEKWKERLEGIDLVPSVDPCAGLRKIKTEQEVEAIQRACRLSDMCLEHLMALVTPGRTEKELLWELHDFLRRHDSEASFEPIVVSGERSARPHGVASDKKLSQGDFITFDLGAVIDGYCSDITRTVVVGKATERQREVYDCVLRAQVAGIDALVAGAQGKEIDALVREVLDEKDLSKHFGHGLGHGLGLLVHDPGRLSSNIEETIEAGQVWTVEPGVYIEGFGGVRIEDDVVVTDDKPRVLTAFPKELIEVG